MEASCAIEGCSNSVFVKSKGWCQKHYTRWRRTGDPLAAAFERSDAPPEERWKQRYRVDERGCWIWTGSLDRHGYGQFDVTVNGRHKNWRAHRWVYTQVVGPLDPDEDIDHVCRVKACVNPSHLLPGSTLANVTAGNAGENNRAKTHCSNGHRFTEENTRLYGPNGDWRECRECTRERIKALMRAKRGTPEDYIPGQDRTHCAQGHEFTPENTRHPKRGGRECIECSRTAAREYMRKKRAAQPKSEVPNNGEKTRCKRGHEFDEKNTRWNSNGSRSCRACERLRRDGVDGTAFLSMPT